MEWTVAVVTTSDVFLFSCYICQRKKQYRYTTNGQKSRKCSLVIPKTQYSDCCVSWIWSRTFRPFLQATKFNTAHLVVVAVFLGTYSLLRGASIISSTNCHQLSLSFGTLSFNFFFSGFHLGTSLSAEPLSLDSVHSPMPKQTCSWCFLELDICQKWGRDQIHDTLL